MSKLTFALLTVLMISGSVAAFGQKLYPIQGPLATQKPVPVLAAKLKRPMFSMGSHGTSSGSITWVLPNGEKLQGTLVTKPVTASSPDTKSSGDPSSYPPQPNLAFAWDVVYGQGYYVANILGKKIWQEVITGDHGTVLQVETYNPYNVSIGINDNTVGAAIDNKGNIYKLAN